MVLAQAEVLAEVDGQLGHPGRVAVGVAVAGLDGADQGPQGLGVAAADVAIGAAANTPSSTSSRVRLRR
jgi:hypothetical protein